MGAPAHRIVLPWSDEMGSAAPERPVPPRPPRPPRPLTMGQVHTRPEPTTGDPFDSPTEEERIWQHCLEEANREVESWFTGKAYRWRPYARRR